MVKTELPTTETYIVYANKIQDGVVEALLAQGITPNCIEMRTNDDYCLFLRKMWSKDDFIVIEHDNIAIDPDTNELLDVSSLASCAEPWCGFEYQIGVTSNLEPQYQTAFGLTCFKGIRQLLPDIWESPKIDRRYQGHSWKKPTHWEGMDLYMHAYAKEMGIEQHNHGRCIHKKDFMPPGTDKLKVLARDLLVRFT